MNEHSLDYQIIEEVFYGFQREGRLPTPLDVRSCLDLIHDGLDALSPDDADSAALAIQLRNVFDVLRNV